MKNVADLWIQMFGRKFHWRLVSAVIFPTWVVIVLKAHDYPPAEWAGIALISYLSLSVTEFVIYRAEAFLLERLSEYLRAVSQVWETQYPDEAQDSPRKQNLLNKIWRRLIVLSFLVQPVYASLILTHVLADVLGFPSLPETLLRGAMYGFAFTLPLMVWFCGYAYFVARRMERYLNVKTLISGRTQLRLFSHGPQTRWFEGLPKRLKAVWYSVGNLDALLAAKPHNA